MSAPVVVIGVGNRFRRDDSFGPLLVDAIAGEVPAGVDLSESDGEPARVIDAWAGADLAVVVESVRHGAPAGSVIDLDATEQFDGAMSRTGGAGSHSLGLAEAIALGRTLGRMPRRLRVVGVEPADLGYGEGLTETVARTLDLVASLVIRHVRAAQEGTPGIRVDRHAPSDF
jgi:hydrogenase maturation protease